MDGIVLGVSIKKGILSFVLVSAFAELAALSMLLFGVFFFVKIY